MASFCSHTTVPLSSQVITQVRQAQDSFPSHQDPRLQCSPIHSSSSLPSSLSHSPAQASHPPSSGIPPYALPQGSASPLSLSGAHCTLKEALLPAPTVPGNPPCSDACSASSLHAVSPATAERRGLGECAASVSGVSGEILATPEIWEALCSVSDEVGNTPVAGLDTHGRRSGGGRDRCDGVAHTDMDCDFVSWDRMNSLMETHEYGGWLSPVG